MKLFVYGTLKKDHYNHKRFRLDTQHMVESYDTVPDLSLVLTNEYYPTAILDLGSHIVGEVWEVFDEALLARLRAMEKGAGYSEILTTTKKRHEVLLFAETMTEHQELPRSHFFPLNKEHTW
jgi:gamma-glutamylcyclotransferase (GGCT)/AIG2-like uncharacterized protein YtfP